MRREVRLLAGCALLLCAAAPPLAFVPVEPRFAGATSEYAGIWKSDGPRIVRALETESGLEFPTAPVEIIVSEGRPMTSFDGRLIRLRAGYSPDYKKATLVHELGHRLAMTLPRTGLDDHRLLYLFLYDAWTDLYGQAFADRMVAIERRIPGAYDYDAAWTWALSQTREERQERLRALRAGARTGQSSNSSASAAPPESGLGLSGSTGAGSAIPPGPRGGFLLSSRRPAR